MPKDLIHIAHRIKKIRTSMKITQEELAERSYTSLSLIRQVEQGSKLPSLGTLIEIANSLGVTVDDILVDVIDKSKPRDQLEYVELISSCKPVSS